MKRMVLNEELPASLRKKLDSDARRLEITVNDAVVKVLSERLELQWEPSPRSRFRPVSKQLKIRVDEILHRKLRMEAARRLLTIRGIVLSVLSEHYGTKTIDPHRRKRKEAA